MPQSDTLERGLKICRNTEANIRVIHIYFLQAVSIRDIIALGTEMLPSCGFSQLGIIRLLELPYY